MDPTLDLQSLHSAAQAAPVSAQAQVAKCCLAAQLHTCALPSQWLYSSLLSPGNTL